MCVAVIVAQNALWRITLTACKVTLWHAPYLVSPAHTCYCRLGGGYSRLLSLLRVVDYRSFLQRFRFRIFAFLHCLVDTSDVQ